MLLILLSVLILIFCIKVVLKIKLLLVLLIVLTNRSYHIPPLLVCRSIIVLSRFRVSFSTVIISLFEILVLKVLWYLKHLLIHLLRIYHHWVLIIIIIALLIVLIHQKHLLFRILLVVIVVIRRRVWIVEIIVEFFTLFILLLILKHIITGTAFIELLLWNHTYLRNWILKNLLLEILLHCFLFLYGILS